jgi:phospholipase C
MGKKRSSRASKVIAAPGLGAIKRFVVLMLENRSFDHMLGYLKATNPAIAGMAAGDYNFRDPIAGSGKVVVSRASATALDFDPSHEFPEVQVQIDGPPSRPRPMSGFVYTSASPGQANAGQVMECFEPPQIPVFTALATEYAVFNFWYSSLPGPTWPNRFFVHAGTSGGLSVSPSNWDIFNGFMFENGTIYERLDDAGRSWRIYHDDLPQALGVWWLRKKYLSSHFRKIDKFYRDVRSGELPDYTFIEPMYDVYKDYVNGNSMHPHNDVARGEQLIKDVYEAIRNSALWRDTMLVVTFDEHGGFYDHVSPPTAPPTGDDANYASTPPFSFDRYGVRVPTILVSAYTERGTVIGSNPTDPATIFDHCSIPATVRKRYRLQPLSNRERNANTVDVALNRTTPRDADAPKTLPAVRPPRLARGARPSFRLTASAAKQLTKDQEAFLALAAALDREITPVRPRTFAAVSEVHRTPAQAAAYAARVQAKALALRKQPPKSKQKARRGKTRVRRSKRHS